MNWAYGPGTEERRLLGEETHTRDPDDGGLSSNPCSLRPFLSLRFLSGGTVDVLAFHIPVFCEHVCMGLSAKLTEPVTPPASPIG